MPNYNLVANTTFQPFTYQELAAPLDRAEMYHEKLAEEYDKLSSQADVLEAMGQNDRDKNSDVYNQYKSYSDDLRKAAEELNRVGLNTESRQALTDMRRRYNTDIVPIQNAWQKREEEANMQIKAQLQHPELRFTRDAANTSLGEYIKNPEGGFGVVNLNNITAMASDAFKNLAKQIRGNKKNAIDKYNDLLVTSYGVDPNLIRDWQNNPNASSTLTSILHEVLAANGLTTEDFLNTPNGSRILAEATAAAKRGAWSAVGEDKTQVLDNFEARENYKYALNNPNPNTLNIPDSFSDSTYPLPMQGADTSYVKEQREAMNTLGYKLQNGKLNFTGKVDIKYNLDKKEVDAYNEQQRREMNLLKKKIDSHKATEREKQQYITMQRMLGRYGNFKSPVLASDKKEVSLYNKKGELMSREQFISQAGKSENLKKELSKYYDKVESANQTLGMQGSYNHKNLTEHYNKLRDANAAQFANVRSLNYGKDAWNPNSRNYKVLEIKGYKNGKPVYSTENISLGELLDKKDSKNNAINVAPYWSEVEGQEGLILATTEDGKSHRYFIPAESMPESNIQEARVLFRKSAKALNKGWETTAKVRAADAIGKLHTGLTIQNSPYNQNIVRQATMKQQGLVGE